MNIPQDELYVKISGDHRQGSMKFAFQLGNAERPNSRKKTVVFSLFEAKDTRNNMLTVTLPYKQQLDDLVANEWQYEF